MSPEPTFVNRAWRKARRIVTDIRGATAVEYGLILGFIVVALIVGLTQLAGSTTGMWNGVSAKVETAK